MRKLLLACVVLFGSVGLASAQTSPKKTLTLTKTTSAQASRANLTQEEKVQLKLKDRQQKAASQASINNTAIQKATIPTVTKQP
ncbi:MAG: hypothetical protein ABI091_22280 [Ferruginibacter sp.]